MSANGINEAGGRSGGKVGPMDSDDWDEPVPLGDVALPRFPTSALPTELQGYVEAVADTFQVPVDVPAMICLAVGGASLAKKAKIQANVDFVQPLNVYVAIAMNSGSGKSPPFHELTAPLEDHERQLNEEQADRIHREAQQYRVLQARMKHLENLVAKGKEQHRSELARVSAECQGAREPAAPRELVENVTPEKLTMLLHQHGGRLGLFSPEGELFNLVAGRYSATSTPNFDVLLHAHGGETIRVDRSGRPADFVRSPALTICTMVQPDVIKGLAQQPAFRHRGLLGRFLFCVCESLVGGRKARRPLIPEESRSAYRDLVAQLLKLKARGVQDGEMQPHVIQLDAAATERLYGFMELHEPRLQTFGEFGRMTDWGGKLAGAVLRIAGILHIVHHAFDSSWSTHSVEDMTMEEAITIGEYLGCHARAAYDLMAADERLEDARHLLGWIQRNGKAEFSQRDAHRGTEARFRRVEPLRAALGILAERGYVRAKPSLPTEAESRRGGRPGGPHFEVNPAVWRH